MKLYIEGPDKIIINKITLALCLKADPKLEVIKDNSIIKKITIKQIKSALLFFNKNL